jgi:radical SAM superfamily enzyme YgiQ (UPF0313 family)
LRVLLVHPQIRIKYGTYGYQAGLAAISAALKREGGCEVRLLNLAHEFNPEKFRQAVLAWGPDLVGFYTTHNQYRFIRRLLDGIPKKTFTILGGPHPTIAPHCLDQTPILDAVCIGEGDRTIVDLVRALKTDRNLEKVAGIRYRQSGSISQNPPQCFIEDLNSLPYDDREVFEAGNHTAAGLLEIGHQNSFRIGRGCPFRCSFCSNASQSDAQPGTYTRFRSIDNVMGEIRQVVARYNPQVLYFQDDTFMTSRSFEKVFCERYPKEVGLPFEFFGHIEQVDEKRLQRIKNAGGRRVSYGVESGDEAVRREVLQKSFTNEDVVRAFALTKKAGIVAEAFVMAGFPGETRETFRATADLLAQIQPDVYTLSVYYPYPGTALYKRAKSEGMLRFDEIPLNIVNQRDMMLRLPGYDREAFLRDKRWFAFRVFGKTSLVKAILFSVYESSFGDRLLRWVTPVRRLLKKYLLRQN